MHSYFKILAIAAHKSQCGYGIDEGFKVARQGVSRLVMGSSIIRNIHKSGSNSMKGYWREVILFYQDEHNH